MKDMEFSKLSDEELDSVAGGFGGGGSISAGSFASNTGTALNILVSWSVTMDGLGQKTLNVTVSSTSYSLYCSGSGAGVELTVNGMHYVSSSPAIQYSGSTMTTNYLAGFSIPNLSGPVNVTAVWHFNGTYSSTPIGDVRASAVVTV